MVEQEGETLVDRGVVDDAVVIQDQAERVFQAGQFIDQFQQEVNNRRAKRSQRSRMAVPIPGWVVSRAVVTYAQTSLAHYRYHPGRPRLPPVHSPESSC